MSTTINLHTGYVDNKLQKIYITEHLDPTQNSPEEQESRLIKDNFWIGDTTPPVSKTITIPEVYFVIGNTNNDDFRFFNLLTDNGDDSVFFPKKIRITSHSDIFSATENKSLRLPNGDLLSFGSSPSISSNKKPLSTLSLRDIFCNGILPSHAYQLDDDNNIVSRYDGTKDISITNLKMRPRVLWSQVLPANQKDPVTQMYYDLNLTYTFKYNYSLVGTIQHCTQENNDLIVNSSSRYVLNRQYSVDSVVKYKFIADIEQTLFKKDWTGKFTVDNDQMVISFDLPDNGTSLTNLEPGTKIKVQNKDLYIHSNHSSINKYYISNNNNNNNILTKTEFKKTRLAIETKYHLIINTTTANIIFDSNKSQLISIDLDDPNNENPVNFQERIKNHIKDSIQRDITNFIGFGYHQQDYDIPKVQSPNDINTNGEWQYDRVRWIWIKSPYKPVIAQNLKQYEANGYNLDKLEPIPGLDTRHKLKKVTDCKFEFDRYYISIDDMTLNTMDEIYVSAIAVGSSKFNCEPTSSPLPVFDNLDIWVRVKI